jgi:hypothetical protein
MGQGWVEFNAGAEGGDKLAWALVLHAICSVKAFAVKTDTQLKIVT